MRWTKESRDAENTLSCFAGAVSKESEPSSEAGETEKATEQSVDLVAQAAALGITVDKRWGKATLKTKIAEAEKAASTTALGTNDSASSAES